MGTIHPGEVIPITDVEVIGPHELRLTFKDGLVGDIAFGDHEWNGVFEPLRDPARFAQVTIEGPTLSWPADGLDMAPEPLYERARRHQATPASTATS